MGFGPRLGTDAQALVIIINDSSAARLRRAVWLTIANLFPFTKQYRTV